MSIPGKLAVFRRSGRASTLALGFTSESITLLAFEGGDWVEVGQADVTAPDFDDQIKTLRAEARTRDRSNSPVTILLPPEQVIERHYTLAAIAPDARWAEATRRVAGETPHTAPELSVAIASDARFEPVKVLAALLQTMTEARSHAAAWGFNPGRISTRVGMRGFAPPGPVFTFPRSVANKAGRTVKHAAAAAVTLALLGGGAFGAYQLVEPMLDAPVAIGPAGPTPSSFSVFLDPPPGPQIPLGDVEKTVVTHLDLPRMQTRSKNLAPSAGTSSRAVLRKTETPRELEAPDSTGPLTVGNAPEVPKVVSIGRAAPSPVDMDKMVIAAIIPIAPISEFTGRSAPEPASGNTESDAATPDPNELRRTDPPETVVETAGEATRETNPETAAGPVDEKPIVVAVAEEPAETAPLDATKFAPEKVTAPRPRPGSAETGADADAGSGIDETTTTALKPPEPRPASLVNLATPKLPAPRNTSSPEDATPVVTDTDTETAANTDPAPEADNASAELTDATKAAATEAAEKTETAAGETTDAADTTTAETAPTTYTAMTSRFGPPPARPGSVTVRTTTPAEAPLKVKADTETAANSDPAPEADTTVTADGVETAGTTDPTPETDIAETADKIEAPVDETKDTAASSPPDQAPATYTAMTSRFGPPPMRPGSGMAGGATPTNDEALAKADADSETGASTDPALEVDTAAAETPDRSDTAVDETANVEKANETETTATEEAPATYVAMTSRFGPPPARPTPIVGTGTTPAEDAAPITTADRTDAETATTPDPATGTESTTDAAPKTETADVETKDETDTAADAETAPATYTAMTSRFGPPPARPGSRAAGGASGDSDETTATADAGTGTAPADTAEARDLPAPRPESLVRLAPKPASSTDTAETDTAPDSGTAKIAAAAPPDPRPRNLTTTAGIASDLIRNDSAPRGSPDDGGSTAGVPVAALTIPTGRPEDLVLSGAPKRAETPVSPKDRERLALAPATTELRVEPKSGTAATKAPEPSKRPRTLEIHARRTPARTRTPLSVYLPRSVGDAAKRSGLALNKTNLIGVIEAKNGRQALVRLPDGGFRKVSRGDSIEGWRVSAVNRESMRLTRRGEKRTLLLVTP